MKASHARMIGRDLVVLPLLGMLDLLIASSVIIHEAPVPDDRLLLQTLVAAAGFAVLTLRHRAPFTVVVILCVHGALAWQYVPEYRPCVALIVAVYTVAVHSRPAVAAAAVGAAVARAGLSGLDSFRAEQAPRARTSEFVVTVVMYALIYLLAWAAGRAVRNHRAKLHQLERRRMRAREEAIVEERRRIAAELHDVVSNAVTVMVLQAAGAAQHTRTDPDRVHDALLQVRDTGRQAMAELRRMLDVMQPPHRSVPLDATAPQPGLRDIEALLVTARGAGLRVELQETGAAGGLDPSVELAAYRMVQESLTNVLKHAGDGAVARVGLAWDPQALTIEVEDGGGRARTALHLSAGYGLIGLAERIRSAGGHFSAAPAGNGYRVTATLPVTGRALPAGPTSGVRHDARSASPHQAH